MARVEISIEDGGKRTSFAVDRLREVDAVTHAMALLAATYGPQIRTMYAEAMERAAAFAAGVGHG